MVEEVDRRPRRAEDIADLVADEVVDRLHVEFGGETILHAVDDGEFRCALFGLFEQALGLGEEAHVFDGDGRLVCEGLE